MAKNLYGIGILPKQSYLAITNFFIYIMNRIKTSYVLVNLLLDELIDPTVLDNFKDFCRRELPRSYKVLSSMGEYYYDIFFILMFACVSVTE